MSYSFTISCFFAGHDFKNILLYGEEAWMCRKCGETFSQIP